MSRSVGLVGVGLGWFELNARCWRPNLDVPRTFIIVVGGCLLLLCFFAMLLCVVYESIC